ncbi:alpha/beta fold hydrolase [Permianibacter sp. IMCC34836]|uniref:alpha/beta hydrolase n=1 Tax=Permianibacter fluminis TaxID=2738515 RepID=UPI001551FACB|nr:alpha/beta fold hydrolase [Permianibacter fluminis]NQD36245.1 alpha/beta fold hydrolase [Permianibacter fluminis]
MLSCIEKEPAAPAQASVIWLHGLGADGHDFEPIVGELRLPADLPIRFIFPHAPVQPVTINGGYAMRAWYDILEANLGRRVDEAGVRQSAVQVAELIEREVSRGIPAHKIVLAGFSQGGAITLFLGLRYPQRLAGLLALSTYLPCPETLASERSAAMRDAPIFMAHGSFDPVVPLALARDTERRLHELDYAADFREYPMPHSVCGPELQDIRGFLLQVLQSTP